MAFQFWKVARLIAEILLKEETDVGDIEFLSVKESEGKLKQNDNAGKTTTGDGATLTASSGKDMYLAYAHINARIQAVASPGSATITLNVNGIVKETYNFVTGAAVTSSPQRDYFFAVGYKVLATQIIKLEITAIINVLIDTAIQAFEEDTGVSPRLPAASSGLASLQKHLIRVLGGGGIQGLDEGNTHEYVQDLNVDKIERGVDSGTLTAIGQATTLEKKGTTTDIQAPSGSDLIVVLMNMFRQAGGGLTSDNGQYRIRATATADAVETSVSDISNLITITGANASVSQNLASILILPAGKFLTLVSTGGNNTFVHAKVTTAIVIGKESF